MICCQPFFLWKSSCSKIKPVFQKLLLVSSHVLFSFAAKSLICCRFHHIFGKSQAHPLPTPATPLPATPRCRTFPCKHKPTCNACMHGGGLLGNHHAYGASRLFGHKIRRHITFALFWFTAWNSGSTIFGAWTNCNIPSFPFANQKWQDLNFSHENSYFLLCFQRYPLTISIDFLDLSTKYQSQVRPHCPSVLHSVAVMHSNE